MEKGYNLPPIVWLKITDYMHGWLQYELGCALRVKDQKVVCVFDVPGAKDVLKMETVEELMDQGPVGNSMSDTWKNCIEKGLTAAPDTMAKEYGMTQERIKLFMPVECPKRCLTKYGVLRPWTLDVNLSPRQATAMQRVLRQAFWDAVAAFDKKYAQKKQGKRYPAVDMIEDFCAETGTPDLYVEAIRREWQRRLKRQKSDES